MDKMNVRKDDFSERHNHLKNLTDLELKARFWQLADQAVEPLVKLAKNNTSPSIERSVLLRMGFSSVEAKAIVDKTIEHHLMGKGAGHAVYKYSTLTRLPIREAGLKLMKGEGWDIVMQAFGADRHEAK
jgi:D-ornithine 4,5-aminomutase subunit alpha